MLTAPCIHMGAVHDVGLRIGMSLTAVAAGALGGPPISGAIADATGSFRAVGVYAGTAVVLAVCDGGLGRLFAQTVTGGCPRYMDARGTNVTTPISVHTFVPILFPCVQRFLDNLLGSLGLEFGGRESVDPVQCPLDLHLMCDLLAKISVLVCAGVETLYAFVFRFALQ